MAVSSQEGGYLDQAFGVHARRAVIAALIRATLGRNVILGGRCAPIPTKGDTRGEARQGGQEGQNGCVFRFWTFSGSEPPKASGAGMTTSGRGRLVPGCRSQHGGQRWRHGDHAGRYWRDWLGQRDIVPSVLKNASWPTTGDRPPPRALGTTATTQDRKR